MANIFLITFIILQLIFQYRSRMNRLTTSLFFGGGVGIILYGSMSNLQVPAYLVNVLYTPLAMVPFSLFWKNAVLSKLNEGQFPADMKSYRQLLIFNRKAFIYQLFVNQICYHTINGLLFIAYTHFARTLYDKSTPHKKFTDLLKDISFPFIKLRFLFSIASLLSQFWIAKMSIVKSQEGNIYINQGSKRILLIKQFVLSMFWMASVAQLVHQHYPLLNIEPGSIKSGSIY